MGWAAVQSAAKHIVDSTPYLRALMLSGAMSARPDLLCQVMLRLNEQNAANYGLRIEQAEAWAISGNQSARFVHEV